VTPDGQGAILDKFEKDMPPFREGDELTLPDGTSVVVIRSDLQIQGQYWDQTVHVGTKP
jgi:hypothetical protein